MSAKESEAPKCEMSGCDEDAVCYGGRSGPFDWEGNACACHADRLDWRTDAPVGKPHP